MPRAASLLSASFAVVVAAVVAFAVVGTGQATRDAALSSHGVKPTLYLGQGAAGAGDARSCANAKAVSFFNTASNWGAGKPIAPGTRVGLCGTITTELTFQGSGTSGNRITVQFQPGAKISRSRCSCFDASGRSFVVIDGGKNGVIEATNNGVNLGIRQATRAIDLQGCRSCTVENLTISNIFVMVPGNSDPIDHTQSNAIYADGANLSVHDNVIHDVGWAIYDNKGTNSRIYNNDISHMDHGITLSGSGAGPVFIYGNHIHDMANWDCGGGCHHDGIHCYTVHGGSPNHYGNGGILIYDNRFDGTVGSDNTSPLFLESNSGSGATPCADATTDIYIFNNYVHPADHQVNNGVITPASGRIWVYENTLVGYSNTTGYIFDCCAGWNGLGAFENNVVSTADRFGGWRTSLFNPIDYNVYANTDAAGQGNSAWLCNGHSTDRFATFKSCAGETHGQAVSSAQLNTDGSPQGTSPVLAAGTNLRPLCTGNLRPLCFDIRGALRPFRMRADAGAFQRETAAIKTKAIGRVRLGSSRSAIERFYGRRSTHRSGRQLLGFLRLRGTSTATYRRHRGLFDVSYAGGKVAAVATTSRYYSTPRGFGVGAAAKLPGGGWRRCGKAFVRRRGGVATVVRVGGGNIVAVAVARSAIAVCR